MWLSVCTFINMHFGVFMSVCLHTLCICLCAYPYCLFVHLGEVHSEGIAVPPLSLFLPFSLSPPRSLFSPFSSALWCIESPPAVPAAESVVLFLDSVIVFRLAGTHACMYLRLLIPHPIEGGNRGWPWTGGARGYDAGDEGRKRNLESKRGTF